MNTVNNINTKDCLVDVNTPITSDVIPVSNKELTEREIEENKLKATSKRKIFLEKVAGRYGDLNEVSKILEDPEISEDDLKEYMNYCEHAPSQHRNCNSWNIFREMKRIAHLKGVDGIIWREDVTGVVKALEKYDNGEIMHFLIVSTQYGSFGLTRDRQIIKEFI